MASIRDLKKDINFVLGDIIEAVYIWEAATDNNGSKEGTVIIDNAIEAFDNLMAQVNKKDVQDNKAHFKGVRADLETKSNKLIEAVNKLDTK
ncbi:MAG: hypothetical protein ED555_14265 [Allomuricauda sp.]|nr:MAG: hypothetical protein ED555_14265 [Allomuricauda sp.]